jgi:hypothetical protein
MTTELIVHGGVSITLDEAPSNFFSCLITPTRCLHFGPNISIDYGADPPKVTLNGATPDEAARAFWNAVHAVVGRPPLFPETAAWDPWENAGGSNDRTD